VLCCLAPLLLAQKKLKKHKFPRKMNNKSFVCTGSKINAILRLFFFDVTTHTATRHGLVGSTPSLTARVVFWLCYTLPSQ
jgi:hypothetical protein